MTSHLTDTAELDLSTARLNDLSAALVQLIAGQDIAGLTLIDPDGLTAIRLPEGSQVSQVLVVNGHLVLIQPDGSAIVLKNAAQLDFVIQTDLIAVPAQGLVEAAQSLDVDPNTALLDTVPLVNLAGILNRGETSAPGSGDEEPVNVGDPLIGLPISPLLPPTDYPAPERLREFEDRGGLGTPDVSIVQLAPVQAAEIDADVDLFLSDFFEITANGAALGEEIISIEVQLAGLPAGTTVSDGTLTAAPDGTLSLEFMGTPQEFEALRLTFPTDFSTDNRSDIASGDLAGEITATSNFGAGPLLDFDLRITPEGDVEIDGSLPDMVADETDAPTPVTPSELLAVSVPDADGSEALDQLVLEIEGLPAGSTLASLSLTLPAGATSGFVTAADNSETLTITLTAAAVGDVKAAYDALTLALPTDFSTANRTDITGATQKPLVFRLTVQTDEDQDLTNDSAVDGQATLERVVDIGFELDVSLSAPADVTGTEDSAPGGGVTVALGISAAVTDIDGSEDSATVRITYAGVPAGASFSGGSFDSATGIWTGSRAEANALTLTLPVDYSGQITSVIEVLSPEGTASTPQTITIAPTGDIVFDVTELVTAETDARVLVSPSSAWKVSVTDSDPTPPPETLDTITLTLTGVPDGTLAQGVPASTVMLVAGTLTFTGTKAQYDALQLSFPTDYSTESPAADGPTITGTLAATSTEDPTGQSTNVTLRITPEGDVGFSGPGTLMLVETDAPVDFLPSQALLPIATDLDGSERVTQVTLGVPGLPPGTEVSLDGGNTFAPVGGTVGFTGTLFEYQQVVIRLPADFSTANPPTTLGGLVTAVTNEGGFASASFGVEVDFESDIVLSGPGTIADVEDGDGVDGGGVTVSPGLAVSVTDADGSEDMTTVTIAFTDLPARSVFSTGSFDTTTQTWTGTMAEANALQITLPGDYSGSFSTVVTASNAEGSAQLTQSYNITPTGDIDFSVSELLAAETDAPVTITPSASWQVSVSDTDLNLPRETLESVTLVLTNVPAGTTAQGVPAGTVTLVGGTLTFTGTEVQYTALQLTFPTDFSTESPAADGTVINGTLSATSTEDAGGQSTPVTLRITPEGDVEIDGSLPDMVADETDAPTPVTPSELLAVSVPDADGSEALDQLVLEIEGLPAGSTLASLSLTLPAGATSGFVTAADNSETLTITLTAAAVGDVKAAYDALTLALPTDFSTANRTDITGATQKPLVFRLTVQTDEDQDLTDDSAVDGQATLERVVDIGFELDVSLSAPADVTGTEDSAPGGGVTVALGISAAVTDIDGSEDSATVRITYAGVPAGASFSGGSFDSATGIWTGSRAEANALTLTLPVDYSGQITSVIEVLSPEGTASTPQTITIAPTGDIVFDVTELVTAETDARVLVSPSSAWKVSVTDSDPTPPPETLDTITLTLTGVPDGTLAQGVPASTVMLVAGTLTFTGTKAQYDALQLSFPTDYSTESPAADGPIITGTLAATSTEDPTGQSTNVTLRITPEGDVEIDDTLPDTVPDETDGPTPLTPSDLLATRATDLDGSEAIDTLVLEIEGLPAGSSLASLNLTLPAGATSGFVSAADGSDTLTVTLTAAAVGNVQAAYDALTLELPTDFSTDNRSDLSSGTQLPLTLRLSVRTTEDQTAGDGLPNDGEATASRVIDIGVEEDVDVTAPLRLDVIEDGGDPTSPGVIVDLGILVTVTDNDFSESATSTDPAFATVVSILFNDLPVGATLIGGGTQTGNTWTGTVAEANVLALSLPPNFNTAALGPIVSIITATTPEGVDATAQVIVVEPQTDVIIDGEVISTETDLDLPIKLSDFVNLVIPPDETLLEARFEISGLPLNTTEASGAGTFTVVPGAPGEPDTLSFVYSSIGSPTAPEDVTLVFPADYSTESPLQVPQLTGTVTIVTDAGTTAAPIPFTIFAEGDVDVPDGSVTLPETDDVVVFKPVDQVLPVPTDADGSESITDVAVVFNVLPAGARFSVDDGVTFQPATATLDFLGTLAEYQLLVIELPADFSTQNPPTTLTAEITAATDEGGSDVGILTVSVPVEGDLTLSGSGTINLTENDAPGDSDEDSTTQAPQDFALKDAVQGLASDADMSESIAEVDVSISGLPNGTRYSTDGGLNFVAVTPGATFVLMLTDVEYNNLVFRLPDDFSTTTDITGTVTYRTDEALLAGETDVDGTDGIETAAFTVSVASEADVEITTADITVIEDLGTDIPLNLNARVTDIDGSESITGITVAFAGLPPSGTTLTDGTALIGPTDSWTGTLAELQALGVAGFPTHFSGIIDITVTVVTDEGTPAGTSEQFALNVTPVAEPTLTFSVEENGSLVEETAPGVFSVKEDTTFKLTFDAATPDRDSSEQLTTLVVENVPAGWVPNTGGVVDLSLFDNGAPELASATISGQTLTLVFQPGVTQFTDQLNVTPLADDDRDVETLTGGDMTATVTSEDTAAGLPTDTQTASDGVDVNVDAVVDGISLTANDVQTNENRDGRKNVDIDLSGIALSDTDGSEAISKLELTIQVATDSTLFDPADTNDLDLRIGNSANRGFAVITQTGSTADTVSYLIEPSATATDAQFITALEDLRIRYPQHFSGVTTIDGEVFWNETRTGDVETDTSDNFNSSPFQITQTINPRAEADLDARVFVRTAAEVTPDSPTEVAASVEDGTVSGAEILTLLESTSDGSGPGQVNLFVGIAADTPDKDGSEGLSTITVANVPTDWIAQYVTGTSVSQSAFFSPDGSTPLAQSEYDKIQSATYDAGTGQLTLTFVPGVTSFDGAVNLQPTLYEDYDVDRDNADPFTSAGDFFADDLLIEMTMTDSNTATTDDQVSSADFDVDVDPVNNIAIVLTPPVGNEQVNDDAGGVWATSIVPAIQDTDGSESITAIVLKNVPDNLTIYVTDAANPTGPKVPALISELGNPPGFNSWSLENGEWLDFEIRGLDIHTAGNFPLTTDIVTTEADGGGTRITTLSVDFFIEPVADGGNPSTSATTCEDDAVQVPIDGNIIDNSGNSPGSPEAILGAIVLSNIVPDSQGRVPSFFDGPPQVDPTNSARFLNELPVFGGSLSLTPATAANLWVLPGQDSNEDIQFDVTVTYYETIDITKVTTGTGTVTITVDGVADVPTLTVQNDNPLATSTPIPITSVDSEFRPFGNDLGDLNYTRLYGYAGFDDAPFELNQRFTDDFLADPTGAASTFESALDIVAQMTEITFPPAGNFDGSETLYYLVTGVDPSVSILGGSPVDATGETFIFTASQISNIAFVPTGVRQVTYYDLTISAIVLEDDADTSGVSGTPEERLEAINNLKGGSVVSEDFTVIVYPNNGTGPGDCEPDQELPLPGLELIGSGDEDTEIALKLKITPVPPFYDSIDDLVNLPNGVVGDFGIGIRLPPGATLSSDPPGAVLFDPSTGLYVIDIGKLGVDPNDPTQTEGSLLFTPPEHESSPANPFTDAETLGPDDPYDNLNQLQYSMILNNLTCGTTDTTNSSFALTINPVPDGPEIIIAGGGSFDEDMLFDLDLQINGIDGGERLVGNVVISVDGTNGGQLLDSSGTPLTGVPQPDGTIRYEVPVADIGGLQLSATQHYSGPLEISVSATTEDINGATLTNSVTRVLDIDPVADLPEINFDNTIIDPETGAPIVDTSGPVPVVNIIEDVPFTLDQVLDVFTPDMDGSETLSIVLSNVPDYLKVTGPSGSGFIDNGDGSFTISETAFPQVKLVLDTEHARTPDALDPTLPAQIPLTISAFTLELANADTNQNTADFNVVVLPDADLPTVDLEVAPTTGVEDAPDRFTLTLLGVTPDPHETLNFEITIPAGSKVFFNNVEQPVVGNVVTIPGQPLVGNLSGQGFAPAGTVEFLPAADFSGPVTLSAVSVTTDTNGSYTDTQTSAPDTVDLTIDPAPDLTLTVTDDVVDLVETDAPVSFSPSAGFSIVVTDPSESVDQVTYTIQNVPAGTSYAVGGGTPVPVTGNLVFTGSLADFNALTVTFPTDYATNGTPLDGSINVTTDEGGDESGNFQIAIDGELDLTVLTNVTPTEAPQDGNPLTVDFGVDATVTDVQATPSETLEEVVVQFDSVLPAGTTASSGATISTTAGRSAVTLTRGSTDVATFALLVAALSITLPGTFNGSLQGEITVETNHGISPAQLFTVDVNDQPVVPGPIAVESTQTTFTIPFADLLNGVTDSDNLTIGNPVTNDTDVVATLLTDSVQITVPDAYVGTPVLTVDVIDDGPGPASTPRNANLDIDTLQMESIGSFTAPDASTKDLMSNVVGAPGGTEIAKGTANDDAVVFEVAGRNYAEIEGFSLMDGADFVDLSAASAGYTVDGGAGADRLIGSTGSDILNGGTGNDVLSGGAGADLFVVDDLSSVDVLDDFAGPVLTVPVDEIDLSSLVQLTGTEGIADRVGYNNGTGALSVDLTPVATVESSPGVFANEVAIIFENASGTQESAIL